MVTAEEPLGTAPPPMCRGKAGNWLQCKVLADNTLARQEIEHPL